MNDRRLGRSCRGLGIRRLGVGLMCLAGFAGCAGEYVNLRVSAEGSVGERPFEANCEVIGPDGKVVEKYKGCKIRNESFLKAGTYRLRATAKCQPDAEAEFDVAPVRHGAHSVVNVSARFPARNKEMFLTAAHSAEPVGPAVDTTHSHLWGKERKAVDLPPNTKVQYVRDLPDKAGQCEDALVKVLDSGVPSANNENYRVPKKLLVERALGMAPSAVAAAKEAEAEKREVQAQREASEARARRDKEISDSEIASGRCTPERVKALGLAQSAVPRWLADEDKTGYYTNLRTKLLVADANGANLKVEPPIAGEVHVFAYGYGQPKLSASDSLGRTTTQSSYRLPAWAWTGNRSSVEFKAQARKTYSINITGEGCTLVMALLRN